MTRNLTTEQHQLLVAVQARLIPSKGHHPSAAAAGCPGVVAGYLAEQPDLRRNLLGALQAIEATAGPNGFLALDESKQVTVLRLVENEHPEEFGDLVRQTYNAYYSNPTVLETIGAPGPPQPHGYSSPPPLNPERLEAVRKRGRLWRDV